MCIDCVSSIVLLSLFSCHMNGSVIWYKSVMSREPAFDIRCLSLIDFLFKFLVIGSAGTGKSCILHQFIENKCEYCRAIVHVMVWSIPERFWSSRKSQESIKLSWAASINPKVYSLAPARCYNCWLLAAGFHFSDCGSDSLLELRFRFFLPGEQIYLKVESKIRCPKPQYNRNKVFPNADFSFS